MKVFSSKLETDLLTQNLPIHLSSSCVSIFFSITFFRSELSYGLLNVLIFKKLRFAYCTKILGCRDPRCKHENPSITMSSTYVMVKLDKGR